MRFVFFTVILSALLSGCGLLQPKQQAAHGDGSAAASESAQPSKPAPEAEQPPTNSSSWSQPTFIMPTDQARRLLLGKWYGIAKGNQGGSKEWLIERLVDGTYRIDFRFTSVDGVVTDQSEVGFWGVSNDVYFRIFRAWAGPQGMKAADPTDPDHYDAYEILALSKGYFRYRHLGLSEIYTVKKMPDHFKLPVVANAVNSEPLKFEF